MGIGYALASGLVQGFTQNIGREMERRAGEKEKLEQYRLAIANAAMTGGEDFNKTNAGLIKDMVARADARFKDQEGIDIFGTTGPSIFGDEAEEFNTLFDSLETGSGGTRDKILIGSVDMAPLMSESTYDAYTKNIGKPQASRALLEGLNQFYYDEGEDAFKQKFGDPTDKAALRAKFLDIRRTELSGNPKDGTKRQIFAPDDIENYDFYNKFLGLDDMMEQENLYSEIKLKAFEDEEYGKLHGVQSADDFIVISSSSISSENPAFAETMVTEAPGTGKSYTILTRNHFEDVSGIELAAVEQVAAYQNVSLDFFMADFSDMYRNQSDLKEALKHVTSATKILTNNMSTAINYTDTDTLADLGQYFMEQEEKGALNIKGQTSILAGMLGTVLSPEDRKDIAGGFAKERDFKRGTNRNEGFKQIFGSTLEEFNRRLEAARTAKSQLVTYLDLVENRITTVKGTALDAIVGALESFFGGTGTVDTVIDLIGIRQGDLSTRDSLGKQLTAYKERNKDSFLEMGGFRSQRDTLAFIIAANMARAEDTAGRLSDGDLQRNLQKLEGKSALKIGEVSSVRIVMDSVDAQEDLFRQTSVLINAPGTSSGFDLETQLQLESLKIRDTAMAEQRRRLDEIGGTTGGGGEPDVVRVTFDEIMTDGSGFSVNNSFVSTTGDDGSATYGTIYQNPAKGLFVVLNKNNDGIAAQGSASQLQNDGIIQAGQPVSPPPSKAAAPVDQGGTVLPDTNKSMNVTSVVTRPGTIGDGGTFPSGDEGVDPAQEDIDAPQPPETPLLALTIDDLANMGMTNFSEDFVLEDPTQTYGSPGAIGTFNTNNSKLKGKRFKRTVDSRTKEVTFVEVR